MISSMTGYGSAEFVDDDKTVSVEIRSVNNRFFKIKIKSPQFLKSVEQDFENDLKKKLPRGSVSLVINYSSTKPQPMCNINTTNLSAYYKMLQQAKSDIGFDGDLSIDKLLNLPGVIEHFQKEELDVTPVKELVCDLLVTAVGEMQQMRLTAGNDIKTEVEKRGVQIMLLLDKVESIIPTMIKNYMERLKERITKLLSGTEVTITKEDLCREVAFFADRSDITEEIKLLTSHVEQLKGTMNKGGQVGKKLEFIVQEMFRESNTMGSKSNDEMMLHHIFDIKTEIEKIKELVLNIE